MKKTKLLTSLAALALVLSLGACETSDDSSDTSDTESSDTTTSDTGTSGDTGTESGEGGDGSGDAGDGGDDGDGEGGSPEADPNDPTALSILESFVDVGASSLTTEWDAIYAKVDLVAASTSDEAYLTNQNDLLYGYIYSVDQDYQTKTDYYFIDGEEWEHEIDDEYDLETYNKRGNSATYVSYFEDSETFDFSEVFDKAEQLLAVDEGESASLKGIDYELTQDEETSFYTLKINDEDGSTYTYITSSDYIILGLGYLNSDEDDGKEYSAECSSYQDVEEKVLNLDPSLWEYADVSSEGLEFAAIYAEDDDDEATPIGYYVSGYDMTLTQKVVAIPSEYEGLPVTSIGNPDGSGSSNAVFKGSTTDNNFLHTVIIPDSVTTIAPYAFYQCYSLTTISIPGSVTKIGDYAFNYCDHLKTINLEEGLEEICQRAFYFCYTLRDFEIPNTVTTIGNYAFFYCYAFRTMEIPSSVTSFGTNVFATCPGLVSIKIPGSIETLSSSTFSADYSLKDVTLGEGLTSIGSSAFGTCYSLSEISLPSTLTSIESSGLACYDLRAVFIPKSVTSIAYNAFNYAYSLSIYYEGTEEEWNEIEITGGTSNNYILNAKKYYNCTGLGDQEGIEYVSDPDAFTYVLVEDTETNESYYRVSKYDTSKDYRAVEIPATYNELPVKEIGSPTASGSGGYVAAGVSNATNYLQYIKIPDSVVAIDPYCFATTYGLVSINIPSGVTEIGQHAFEKCYALQTVTFEENSQCETFGTSAFDYCYALSSINLPDSLKSLGQYCFRYADGITSLEIPEGVTSLGASMFYQMSGLRRLVLPSSLESIGASLCNYVYALNEVKIAPDMEAEWNTATFSGCYNLSSINLPSTMTALPGSTFNYCYGLESIVIPEKIESIGSTCFGANYALTDVYYCGTPEEWEQITIDEKNTYLEGANLYFYATTRPEEEGNYWHYVNGQAVAYTY